MKHFLLLFCIVFIVSCKGERYSYGDGSIVPDVSAPMAESEAFESYISSPTMMGDTSRKFIRTTDIRFRAENVERATNGVEGIVSAMGGVVTKSNITSSTDNHRRENISDDQTIIATLYTVTSDMVLRVPTSKMDTTLKAIAHYIEFLDFRNLSARDVALEMLSEQLKAKRNSDYVDQVDNGSASTKVADKVLERKESIDNAKLSSYLLSSQVEYCTINLSMYQANKISYQTVARLNDDKFAVNFSYELSRALDFSWSVVKELFLLLVRLSGLLVLGLVIFFGIRYYKRYRRNKKSNN